MPVRHQMSHHPIWLWLEPELVLVHCRHRAKGRHRRRSAKVPVVPHLMRRCQWQSVPEREPVRSLLLRLIPP